MDRNTMRATAREQLKGFCRVCPVCDGRACAGEVPGMGGVGTGGAFKANMDALARVKLNLRTIHAVKEPDLGLTLWGRTLAMPVLVAPITGSTYNMGGTMTEEAFIAEMVAGGEGIEGLYPIGTAWRDRFEAWRSARTPQSTPTTNP